MPVVVGAYVGWWVLGCQDTWRLEEGGGYWGFGGTGVDCGMSLIGTLCPVRGVSVITVEGPGW